jgi:hypothetical protein
MPGSVYDLVASLPHLWGAAQAALDSAVMTVSFILFGAILAAAGGFVSTRMRLYGAIMGGMIINIAVKAMGGSYASALAAMLLVTAIAFALGCTPLLLRLLRSKQARH